MVKPDQLIKRRGKLGLIKVNVDLQGAKEHVKANMGKEITVNIIDFLVKSNVQYIFIVIYFIDWSNSWKIKTFYY